MVLIVLSQATDDGLPSMQDGEDVSLTVKGVKMVFGTDDVVGEGTVFVTNQFSTSAG